MNHSLPIAKWYENILSTNLLEILNNILQLEKFQFKKESLEQVNIRSGNKNFFILLYCKSIEVNEIVFSTYHLKEKIL